MKSILRMLSALLVHHVVDNTPAGGLAPDTQDPQPKVIPTLPPADPTLDKIEANTGVDSDQHTTIAGLDADGQPVTVEHVLTKQDELNAQTGAGNEPNPALNPYIGKDPQSTSVPEVNADIDPATDPTRSNVSGAADPATDPANKPLNAPEDVQKNAGGETKI